MEWLGLIVFVGIVLFAIYKMSPDDHPVKVAIVAALAGAAPFAEKLLEMAKGWLE